MSQEINNALVRQRWQAWALIGAFGLLLLGFGLSYLLALRGEGFAKTSCNGWNGFADGKPMRALADDLRSTPLANWLGQRQREIGWLVLKDLGPRVRQGCPGWLFLMDEMKPHPAAEKNAKERLAIASRLNKALAARGSRLVIALVPDKTRIEHDHLCDLPRPAAIEACYDHWIRALTTADIAVIDIREALLSIKQRHGAAFYRTDTHWNLEGAQAAAIAIAERVEAMGFAPSNPRLIVYQATDPRPRWGDLVRLAGLDKLPEDWRPVPDEVADLHFEVRAQTAAEVGADALFGDTAQERIALIGTSFSLNAHFADFLAAALKSEVGNFARDGGGFAQAMEQFLAQEMNNEAPTAWIIWEIPERVLREPTGDGEQAILTRLESFSVRPSQTQSHILTRQ